MQNEEQKDAFCTLVRKEWDEDFYEIEQKYSPQVLLGAQNDRIIAGVALFFSEIPEEKNTLFLIENHLGKDAVYLGYLVIDDRFRGKGIGSEFIKGVIEAFPGKRFWLVIEDPALKVFYEKNGFRFVKNIGKEKVFCFQKDR